MMGEGWGMFTSVTRNQLGISIRRAVSSDASALTRIAHAAKRRWGYPERWIEAWSKELTITEDDIVAGAFWVAEADGQPLGLYALLGDPAQPKLEHMWVDPAAMHGGVGRTLFMHAAEQARARGAKALTIDADPNAAGFYQRMGAVQVGMVETSMEGVARQRPQYLYDLTTSGAKGP